MTKNSLASKILLLSSVLLIVFLGGWFYKFNSFNTKSMQPTIQLEINSPDFEDWDFLPVKFSCEGGDEFPTIIINNLPPQTQALAIRVQDPDAPIGVFVHLLAIIPSASNQIDQQVLQKAILGINNFGKLWWWGPCPPRWDKPHHYFFEIWALKQIPNLQTGFDKKEFQNMLKNTPILAHWQIVGLFERK